MPGDLEFEVNGQWKKLLRKLGGGRHAEVIRAQIDTENSCALSYPSGGIENPDMNRAIVDVLEGTRPAFDKRDAKYRAVMTDTDGGS